MTIKIFKEIKFHKEMQYCNDVLPVTSQLFYECGEKLNHKGLHKEISKIIVDNKTYYCIIKWVKIKKSD